MKCDGMKSFLDLMRNVGLNTEKRNVHAILWDFIEYKTQLKQKIITGNHLMYVLICAN